VHDAERIFALDDVDARQRAPCSADSVEGSAAAGPDLLDFGKLGFDDALGAPWTRLPRTSIISSEPPPRSPTMPSGLCTPDTTPSADNFASRGPDRISIFVPQIRSALAMKSGPLLASRQAAVAIA
jgi:hypothetical protein